MTKCSRQRFHQCMGMSLLSTALVLQIPSRVRFQRSICEKRCKKWISISAHSSCLSAAKARLVLQCYLHMLVLVAFSTVLGRRLSKGLNIVCSYWGNSLRNEII